jgi:hypothetical protein
VLPGLQVFLEDALGITDGLNSQFLIVHSVKLQRNRTADLIKIYHNLFQNTLRAV